MSGCGGIGSTLTVQTWLHAAHLSVENTGTNLSNRWTQRRNLSFPLRFPRQEFVDLIHACGLGAGTKPQGRQICTRRLTVAELQATANLRDGHCQLSHCQLSHCQLTCGMGAGTPHNSAPPGSPLALVDQTRGLLKYINDNFPSGYLLKQ